jgi:hypothetical protein
MAQSLAVYKGYCRVAILILGIALNIGSCAKQQQPDQGIRGKLPFGGVNTPTSTQSITGKVEVTGWALSEGGIASVSVYIDGSFVTDCILGQARPDVSKVYPSIPEGALSGWTATFDSANFTASWHNLTIQAKSKSGATRDLASLPVLVQK